MPCITKPTRITDTSATLIDNIFTNFHSSLLTGIVISDISDHYPIFANFPISQITGKQTDQPLKYKFTDENMNILKGKLTDVDWSIVYTSQDVNVSYEAFINTLTLCVDNTIPQTKQQRFNRKKVPKSPWITKTLLRSINRKNNLYYKYVTNKSKLDLKTKYLNYKNVLTSLLRAAKKQYFVDQSTLYENDMKNTWKVINSSLNKAKKSNLIPNLTIDDNNIDDPNIMAESLNSYFSQIGENIARTIPDGNKLFHEYLKNPNDSSIFFTPTNSFEIINIVNNLKTHKSPGFDGINNFLLKSVINQVVDPLVYIVNLSLLSGQVPNDMKLAKVIPIFKKGDNTLVSNYRPISLLTSLSKVLEKIVYKRTIDFLNKHNILSNEQFGFREKHSTTHALLSFIDKIARSIDSSRHTIGIFLDLSKAFDTINHNILLYKLSHYGIRGKALEWFRNYLTNRRQFVHINGISSSKQPVSCGVPQGSLLGPLLFLIYINDIQNSSNILQFILFADDSNIFFSHSNPTELVATVNRELSHVTDWIKANKLSLNVNKTNYMFFSNTLNNPPNQIMFDKMNISQVSSTKFLGVTIDNKLSWNIHIDNICKTISRNIGIIAKLKHVLPLVNLLMLYNTLIVPYLNYGILAWGNACSNLLNRLFLLQKKVLRIIHNISFRSHTDNLFFQNKILKITDIYQFQLGQFMYNLKNNNIPPIFKTMFVFNNTIHKYPTRQANFIHLPLKRTLFAQKTFVYAGPKLWNSLSDDIKQSVTMNTFKSKLKKLIFCGY